MQTKHTPAPYLAAYATSTGGGCTALQVDLPSGAYLLITDDEGSSCPVEGQPYIVGLYSPDGDMAGFLELPKWEPNA